MPEIITGRAYSSMRSILYEKIRCAAADRDVLLIIPDQFSFETDKKWGSEIKLSKSLNR